MFAGKPFPGATKAGVDLIEDQQGLVLVAESAEHRQEAWRRKVNAAAHLNRLDQDRANSLTTEQAPDSGFDGLKLGSPGWGWGLTAG